MRWLLRFVMLAAALWGGYWYVGSRGLDAGARDWFAAQGGNATYSDLAVAGFPSRFDLTVTDPRVTDAQSGLTWSAPFAQLLTLSYTPWHFIAVFPPDQRLEGRAGGIRLRADKLQASLVLRPALSLPLDRLTLVGDGVRLEPDGGPAVSMQSLRFASRPVEGRVDTHEFGLSMTDLAPDPALLAGLDMPAATEAFDVRLIAAFSAPLDRFATRSRPRLTELELEQVRIVWGDIEVSGTGKVIADTAGAAEGAATLTLRNWRKALDLGAALGLLDPDSLPSITNAAQFLASRSPDPDLVSLELRFAQGVTTLQGLPIGPAPRLR